MQQLQRCPMELLLCLLLMYNFVRKSNPQITLSDPKLMQVIYASVRLSTWGGGISPSKRWGGGRGRGLDLPGGPGGLYGLCASQYLCLSRPAQQRAQLAHRLRPLQGRVMDTERQPFAMLLHRRRSLLSRCRMVTMTIGEMVMTE